MGIGSVTDYNSYWLGAVPPVSRVAGALQKPAEPVKEIPSEEKLPEISLQPAIERKNTALEDISLSFNKQDDFNRIGTESDIKTLDMEKAISDMKKDGVLQRYQYFVGNSSFKNEDPALVYAGDEGRVIAK
ncbi:MAG: hypothetical protein J6033_06930 [Lachnospiraceae bacterium]|nr:hypothetical protein [Lachnospiraceae bacterium]